MRDSRRPRGRWIGAWAPLAVAACAVPEPDAAGGAPAAAAPPSLQVQDPIARAAQDGFLAWAESLPAESALPPMTMTMDFTFAGRLDQLTGEDLRFEGAPAPEDLAFSLAMSMSGEIQDLTRFRARMDVNMDMGQLNRQSGGRPTVMGCDFVADGETLWIQPDWSQAWFIEDLRGQGVGIENMVFTVRMDTLRELIQTVPLAAPEESRALVASMFECAANPACLARLLARTARVNSFERRADRILAELEISPQFWASPEEIARNPFLVAIGDEAFRYRMEFDAATGASLRSESASASADGAVSFRYRTEIAEAPFPPERFVFVLPAARKVFPVDVFMKPIIHQIRLSAGEPHDPTEGDFEF